TSLLSVQLSKCDYDSVHFTTTDTSFSVQPNGVIVAVSPVSMAAGGRTFSLRARDDRGPETEMEVHLFHPPIQKRKYGGQGFLVRSKRRWSPPPFNILENDKGPYPKDIEKIVSDSEAKFTVYYTISGPGSTEHPRGLFTIDKFSGMLTVHRAVDREEYPMFTLRTRVFDRITNMETDKPLDINVIVDDLNDNAPQFKDSLQFTVLEQSKPGTVVGKVNATDRDQEGTDHVVIKYTLLTGSNLFAINPKTGIITTTTNTLDREVKDKHMVVIQLQDRNGDPSGLITTGTATITLMDINDNPPTFAETSYAVSVNENEKEKLILRIPVTDKDLKGSPNWISKFVITKGNENGNFRIDTDPETNEGLLYVTKPLDHEKANNIKLEISARNEAELSNTNAQWMSIPVDVSVKDVDEGPEFSAPIVRFNVKENIANGTVIGKYTATDPETKNFDCCTEKHAYYTLYYKINDPDSWINVDRNTGELRIANTVDRESPFATDGIYNVTMKAVDASLKTGTGTVIIQVEDVNDNMPMPSTGDLTICEKDGDLGSVVVVAQDKDQSPYSYPFTFSLPSDNNGKWALTRLNVMNHYTVPVEIKDLQGYGGIQMVPVRICQCRNGVCLARDRSVSLGGLALLTMLLPLALLLLLALLLAFSCVTKREKLKLDDGGDSNGILLPSNTEGKGDEVDPSRIYIPPVEQYKDGISGWTAISPSAYGGQSIHDIGTYKSGLYQHDVQQIEGQFVDHRVGSGFDKSHFVQDSSLMNWHTSGRLGYFGTEDDGRYADDIVRKYEYEGVGSTAGSVGCCSEFDTNENLDFLNTLGPKFKNLAEVCRKT
uniref:Desmocollin-2-like n=1 Tax=Echeneis naucrates TaxID=173247 RepID=A0A665VP38_ECHNA